MEVVTLTGGIGGGRFLRGLVRAVPPRRVTAVVNTGDDITMHGLRVCPDLDSVTYWLGDAFDRERGWGRRGETFRATEELGRFDPDASWFGLGDLDLATHLFRTALMADGMSLSEVTKRVAARFGIATRILPMSDDPVETRIDVVDLGHELDLHFQEYWVRRGGRDHVKGVRFAGAVHARPAAGVLEAIETADVVVLAPSNPVVSVGPILSVPGIRDAVERRREACVGVSGIVAGAPIAGMADRLMPALGIEVTAAGVATHYAELISAFLIDERDRELAGRVTALGIRVGVMDTVMRDDARAEAVARSALELITG
jgi:LPPG:FO 2-phospho-L-lactate transferase